MQKSLASLAVVALLAACASTPSNFSYKVPDQPEGSSGYTEKPGWATTKFAVAAANPLATDAGYQILKAGGSAMDAAIAVQMVLTLVEPQSSGIGGGAFLLHFNGKDVEAFDGRETAPMAATEKLFLKADGKPMAFYEGVVGGRSVGTPGTVRMLEMAHKQHGKLPWSTLFQPAIALAEGGFKVSARLNTLLKSEQHLKKDPVAAAYFYKADGTPHDVGHVLKNPELAAVLRKIAAQGSKGLLEGDVAQAIVDKVQKHPDNPGQLSLADLANYQPKKRAPICHDYKANARDFRICGFPPPSSGAIAVGQILGTLNHAYASAIPLENGLPGAAWLHLYTEAARMAFADRGQYVADPDFVQPPQMVKGFLLNNELTDFSFAPADAEGKPIANRVQPGKRPRSSMAPTLVFDKATGQLVMSGGSPGGALIIHYTAKTLYGVLNWGMTPQQAINLPNFGSNNGPSLLEEKRFPPATVEALRARGAEVREQNMTSGLQAITRGQAHGMQLWFGGADPRREGIVMGD
ncbi:MAG: gamma-glutamyltransferase family protein [Ramlibacter sp.]|nr:gamma-glutamyltransferase family protein [Ramlibacter sp.]